MATAAAEARPAPELFDLDGLTCAACVAAVERAIRGVEGVANVEVSLPLRRASVHFVAPAAVDPQAVSRAVRSAGYGARPRSGAGDDPGEGFLQREARAARERADELRVARRRALLAGALTLPLVGTTLGGLIFGLHLPSGGGWVLAALATGVLIVARGIFGVALRQARRLSASMDTLVALGTFVAWAASIHALVRGEGHLHFGPVGMIVSFVLLGRFLEARAQGSTGAALHGLLDLAPPTALRLGEAGEAADVPLGEVRQGDRLRVLPGALVPTDGVVLVGNSSVSEALVTGESLPVPKAPGDAVTGGTTNGAGPLLIRAERVGRDTVLARIVRLVAQAQGSKAAVERLADRVSGVFVPVIIALAAASGLGWAAAGVELDAALLAAVAVLVVACPCALGLATPTAIVVAIGRAARAGILVRDAASLEALADISHVVFDKTGTLTSGQFAVQAVTPAGAEVEEAQIVALAAALEANSEHPLAAGIVAEQRRRNLPALPAVNLEVAVGGGLAGTVAGARIRVGSPSWLASEGLVLDRTASQGSGSVVGVARGETFLGTIQLSDDPRPSAGAAVERLRELGITPVLLTGDRQAAADEVAAALGITEVLAEVPPEGKLTALERLRRDGARVAMVGDGLNDAPALAGADVGIAMGQGTEVAKEAASIMLLRDDPLAVAEAVALARETLRCVRQNLAWAFGYNLVTVPLAMAKLLHPALAAAAMASSSVLVVLNSLRLRGRG